MTTVNPGLLILYCSLSAYVATASWNFAGKNVARGKATKQTSTRNYGSSLAVDGNNDTYFHNGSCTHTIPVYNKPASWTVYLSKSYILKGIRIFNRGKICYRLRNFKIIGKLKYQSTELYNDKAANPQLYNQSRIDVPIVSSKQFSSISIRIPAHIGWPDKGKSILTLCEVQIYTVDHDCTAPSSGRYLLTKVRQGTGYINTDKGLVSTGTIFDFSCEGHYKLNGSTSIKCLTSQEYNSSVPYCVEIQCSRPTYSQYSNYTQTLRPSYSVGETVNWECEQGYESEQNRTRQCLVSSQWSEDPPTCTPIKCSFPGTLSNGDLQYDNNTDYIFGKVRNGTSILVLCAEGFNASNSVITCIEGGQWDSLPQCIPVQCSRPVLTGGYYTYMLNGDSETNDKDIYEYGTVATAVCNETLYRLSMDIETLRTCGQDGNWAGDGNLCVIADGEAEKSILLPVAVGGGVGTVVLVLVAVVVVLFVFIRKRKPKEKATKNDTRPELVFSNDAFTEGNLSENHCMENNSNPESLSVPASSREIYKDANIYENNDDTADDPRESYYNLTDSHKIPERAIMIDNLADLVLAPDSATGRFQTEFEAFPEGMTKQHTHASQNMRRNRYRGLYAYDHTRVVLDIWDEEKDSDYINACYIHGIHVPKAYIASQGPVKDTLSDFWRMVWQNKCGKIVMLTNLMEETKMKCEQYWPKSGTTKYGSVVVTLKSTETVANFVIRTLVVSKGQEQRHVIQFHFTAWPDKDVPYFCASFVHFRSKVKATKTACDGPLVVHCSAGIGRTGTFIAVDYLVDQAETHGYVNVSGCVESLRHQRVNMVQTKKQYYFVHLALVEILTMKTSAVSTATFEEIYQELLSVDNGKGKRRLDLEFEMLWGMLPVAEENLIKDAKDPGTKSQNRYSTILPFKEFMPSLSQPGRHMFGEFINAAFLPMYKEDNALIITQSPLETTIWDFWNMVLHQGVHTIVMVNHVTELKVTEQYWPKTDARKTYGKNIRIDNKNVEKKRGHTIVTMTITTEKEVRDLKLIQFEKWDKGKPVPKDATQIVSALELMEENQRRSGNHPVIVHCMDGVEKSGLFCVMAAVLDRLKIEQESAISQVIQEMRNRRQNVIPNVTQFQFCHEVVLAFLKQYDTYSNFEVQHNRPGVL